MTCAYPDCTAKLKRADKNGTVRCKKNHIQPGKGGTQVEVRRLKSGLLVEIGIVTS